MKDYVKIDEIFNCKQSAYVSRVLSAADTFPANIVLKYGCLIYVLLRRDAYCGALWRTVLN